MSAEKPISNGAGSANAMRAFALAELSPGLIDAPLGRRFRCAHTGCKNWHGGLHTIDGREVQDVLRCPQHAAPVWAARWARDPHQGVASAVPGCCCTSCVRSRQAALRAGQRVVS